MNAPSLAGTYTSYWKLRSDNGADFGIGVRGERAFWAKIEVTSSAPIITPAASPTPMNISYAHCRYAVRQDWLGQRYYRPRSE